MHASESGATSHVQSSHGTHVLPSCRYEGPYCVAQSSAGTQPFASSAKPGLSSSGRHEQTLSPSRTFFSETTHADHSLSIATAEQSSSSQYELLHTPSGPCTWSGGHSWTMQEQAPS